MAKPLSLDDLYFLILDRFAIDRLDSDVPLGHCRAYTFGYAIPSDNFLRSNDNQCASAESDDGYTA